MKSTRKSNVTNYRQLYSILIVAITFFLLYITINFLLPVANFISIFALSISLFTFLLYLFTKQFSHLIIALISCILAITFVFAFLYFN